jgi:cation diffusion facilitator CzcD-associated flavoprotein CzcO
MNRIMDIAVLGAGPYGLAAGSHLHNIKGLDVQVFGEPMEFWKSQMPAGMFLRSPWSASHIGDPKDSLTMDSFQAAHSLAIPKPIPLDHFVNYGLWFQQQAVATLDKRRITRVERGPGGFQLTLQDGEVLNSRRVVIAAGIAPFARRPEVFAGLSCQFVTHCSDQRDVERFRGKKVVVVGAGQSALESAALIHEAGGAVEVIARTPTIHWLGWRARIQQLGPIAKLLYAPTDVGPAGVSRIVAYPNLVKYFPRSIQNRFRTRSLRPAGSVWLANRLKNARVTTGTSILSAVQSGERLLLKLDNGESREVDHILLGTGYRVDIARYPFLAPELVQQIRQMDGFPLLNRGFESSIPGLHFLGAPSSWRFGPLMYFVAGTQFAGRTVANYVAKNGKTQAK